MEEVKPELKTYPFPTLQTVARGINFDWKLEDWFQWPADAFLLVSTIINRVGLYKYCLLDTPWWNHPDWTKDITELSDKWTKLTSNHLLGIRDETQFEKIRQVKYHYRVFQEEWENEYPLNIDYLRVMGNFFRKDEEQNKYDKRAKGLARALIYIQIAADVTCAGLGLLDQPLKKGKLTNRVFMTMSNLLLNNTGTLSTIPKFQGIVVPKMRTPQSGMGPRSMTHNLSCHQTEVEVIWRTFPRLDEGVKTLNILAVPYPYKIKPEDFVAIDDDNQAVRYFTGDIEHKLLDNDFLYRLVEKVAELAAEKNDVDIIVLPEMSVSEKQFLYLLEKFEKEFDENHRCTRLPIIVAGVMKVNPKSTGKKDVDTTFLNEARIAAFFAGKWYATTQRKHHRWKLDASQIANYGLQIQLPGNKPWFEYSSVAQRRLTILAPHGWMALSALICEDLARQEPVSDLIRGIGPNLLLALLSDGPQLNFRWSARYASGLADDPGTAVLSLTSLGMTLRSRNPDPIKAAEDDLKPAAKVAIWKDMLNSWKELEMNKRSQAFLFKIEAEYQPEFTLDGRTDGGFASVFKFVGDEKDIVQIDLGDSKDPNPVSGDDPKKIESPFSNIRELSALQFSIDALLDIVSDDQITKENADTAIDMILSLLIGKQPRKTPARKFRERIINNIVIAWEEPERLGIAATPAEKTKEQMQYIATELKELVEKIDLDDRKQVAALYWDIINYCENELIKKRSTKQEDQTFSSFLYNIFNRLVTWENDDKNDYEISGMNEAKAINMKKKIKEIIRC